MMERLRSAFASLVVLREEEAVYTARFVAWLLPVAMVVLALLTVFPLMAGDLAQRAEVGVPVLAAWAVAWLLVRRGRVRRAAVVFIVGTWVVLTYAAATRGGVHAPAYAGYVLVLTYAALLVSPALAALIFVVSVAAGAAMVVAEYHTRLPLSMVVHTPTTLWATETAGMFLIVLLVVVIAHEYRRVFDRLRADEEEARLLFEVDRDPILLLSTDGRFIDGNEAAAKAFGVASRAELVGRTPVEFSPDRQPDGQPSTNKAAQVIGAALREGSTEFEWTHRRAGGSEFVAEVALTVIPRAVSPMLMAHLRDITARQQAQKALVRRVRLEQVILDASTSFINVAPDQLDHEIDRALEKLGSFAGADRAYVFQRREGQDVMDCTHEWCREGVSAQIDRLQDAAAARFPWFAARLHEREPILVPRVSELPPEAASEREEFERQGVESMICVPMVLEDRVVGFLGFESVHAGDVWSEETVTLLRVAADATTNALARRRAAEALRESEERYRSLVEATSDWIWEVDADGVYTYASPKVRDLLGYEPEEVVGRTPFDLMPPEEAQRVAAAVRANFEQGIPISQLENLNLHRDGHEVVLQTSGVPLFDDHKTFRGFRGIDRDITEQKRAAESLRESEERYRQFLRISAEGIWRLEVVPPIPIGLADDEQAELILERARVAECNDVLARRYGFHGPEEVEGARLDALWVEGRESKLAAILAFIRGGYRITDLETSGQLLDGTRGHFVDNFVGVVEGGLLTGAWGTERDVTYRRRAEEALRESQARYQRFLQISVEGIWRLEAVPPVPIDLEPVAQAELILERTRVGECNDAFARRYGFGRPEDMVGARLDELWIEPHEAKIAALLQFIRGGYRISDLETRGRYPDGRRGRFANNLVGEVENGLLLLAWGTQRDVTERWEAQEALRRERDLVRTLMDTSPVGIIALDRERRVTFVNAEAEEIFGLSREELTARTYSAADWRITDYEGRPVSEDELPFKLVESTGRAAYGVRYAIQRPTGERVLLSANAAPLFTESGEFDGIVAAIEDVTELTRAEEALRESEERFRAIVESTRDWIWFADTAGIHRYSNRAVHELLGYTPEEIVGNPVFEFMHPEDAPLGRAAMEQAIAGRCGWSGLVVRWRHENGTYRYLESAASPAFGPTGRLLGWYGVDRDITERMATEEALRRSEARLRALFAAMTDVIFVLDFEGRYLEIAPTQPDLLYRPAEELLGRTVHEIFPPEQADFFHDAVRRVLTSGETTQIEYGLLISGRELRFVATLSRLSPDSAMVVARDVTAQVQQYERLLALERARADLAEHLNAEINHRARNNLAMVSGLLQMQALQEPDTELASRLREAVARIRTFVDIHEKIYATGAEQVDLTEVLRQVAATLSSVYASVGAVFSVEGAPLPCPTRGATNLAVATNELVTNALKYGAPGPEGTLEVVVRTERTEGQVRLSVWNSGNPVPEGFEPAAQHGMGLRLVTDMAQQYGGALRVVPEQGGTLAELSVPEEALER
jgi:PAS domain S-box-containing protein